MTDAADSKMLRKPFKNKSFIFLQSRPKDFIHINSWEITKIRSLKGQTEAS